MIPRRLFLALVSLTLAAPTLRAAEPNPPVATILCYHIVESPSDTKFSLSRETFDLQMRYLASAGYKVIPMAELSDFLLGRRKSLPPNAVVVTIDDGWKCTHTEIWPVMKKYNLPFTVFIYPKFIGQSGYALKWKEVKEMSDAGVDIQSHSYSHPFLTQRRHRSLDDGQYSDWLAHELHQSKRAIEEKTGKPVKFLAYPYGDFDARVVQAAADSGYEAAVIAEFGNVRRDSDRYKLRRVVIDTSQSFSDFRRLMGAGQLKIATSRPAANTLFAPREPVITARIAQFKDLDPSSVGMTVLNGSPMPFTYNPADGTVATVPRVPFMSNRQQVVIWGRNATTGKRVEAVWSFYATELPVKPLPKPVTLVPAEATRQIPEEIPPVAVPTPLRAPQQH